MVGTDLGLFKKRCHQAVGLATVLAGFSLVPAAWWLGDAALQAFTVILALFLLFMHRSNIQRLREGTENRFERVRLFRRRR